MDDGIWREQGEYEEWMIYWTVEPAGLYILDVQKMLNKNEKWFEYTWFKNEKIYEKTSLWSLTDYWNSIDTSNIQYFHMRIEFDIF